MELVAHIVKFNSQTAGRDKLCRAVQYSSKLIYSHLQKAGLSHTLVEKLKILESQLSSTRKVLRIGKSVDMVQGAWRSSSLPNTILRHTLTLSKLNQACYLLLDHLVWLGKIGLVKADVKKWGLLQAKFWLVTLMLNLFRDLYDISNLICRAMLQQKKVHIEINHNEAVRCDVRKSKVAAFTRCVRENAPLTLDIAKNLLDLVLPLSILEYIQTTPATQGLAGTLSSLLAITVLFKPALKMSPS